MIELDKLKSRKVEKFEVFYRNLKELERIHREVFINQEYKFSSEARSPFIVDCGSHIGLSILYFKSIYPNSEIIGFEPNPENFQILKKNIKVNNLSGVKIFNCALSNKAGKTNLHVGFEKDDPWTWGDTIIYNMWGDKDKDKKISVKTVRLSAFIDKPVDLIKMDIEGSEQVVIEEIESKLSLVKEIVIEYHGTKTSKNVNDFSVIRNILARNGFLVKMFDKNLRFAFPDFVANLRKTSSIFSIRAIKK